MLLLSSAQSNIPGHEIEPPPLRGMRAKLSTTCPRMTLNFWVVEVQTRIALPALAHAVNLWFMCTNSLVRLAKSNIPKHEIEPRP